MADEQSIWKKEISFGRKRKDPEPEATEAGDAQSGAEPTSIWKKELSFGRKKNAAPAPEPAPEDVQAPAAEAAPVIDNQGPAQGSDLETGSEEAAAEEPMWTRAVSFSPSPAPEESTAAEPVVDENVVVPCLHEPPLRRTQRVHAVPAERVQRRLRVGWTHEQVDVVLRRRPASRPDGEAAAEREVDAGAV